MKSVRPDQTLVLLEHYLEVPVQMAHPLTQLAHAFHLLAPPSQGLPRISIAR